MEGMVGKKKGGHLCRLSFFLSNKGVYSLSNLSS